ncbi:MAG: YciI family protein [Solirubrobacteraceae bacterium]|nr:YciI family protein [Solirubrobacteraceae bacterium]
MRFMLFMYPNLKDDEWDADLPLEDVSAMQKYNESLVQAGVLLAGDGLHPASAGARVRNVDGTNVVTDGPFAEAKEVVGGYWILDVKTPEEAKEWASRVPLGEGDFVELRRVFEMEDFSEEIQQAAALSSEPPEQTVSQK